MKHRIKNRPGWAALLAVGLLLSGCAEKKPPPEEKPVAPAEKRAADSPMPRESLSPEEAIRRMVAGMKENRPEVIWRAMPPGFQRDLNGLVREFAHKMDPELWQQSFKVWKALAQLLEKKKDAILSHPAFANLPAENRKRLAENWDGLVGLLSILVNSDLGDLDRMREFEMGEFLKKTGGEWFSQLASLSEALGQDSMSGMFAGLEPTTISADENTAVMGWMTPGSAKPVTRFSVVKLDGRWIPAGWEAAWQQVRAWRAALHQTSAEPFREQSRQKLETLAKAESTIEALRKTKTPEEFQQTLADELGEENVGELAALLAILSGSTTETAGTDSPSPRQDDVPKVATDASTVTLIVKGAKGVDDEDRIFDSLQKALPGDVDVQFSDTPEGLKVVVGPVGDLADFRKKLGFGTVTKFDEQERVLQMDLKK